MWVRYEIVIGKDLQLASCYKIVIALIFFDIQVHVLIHLIYESGIVGVTNIENGFSRRESRLALYVPRGNMYNKEHVLKG